MMSIALQFFPGVIQPIYVLITCRGVLLIRALPTANSVWGANEVGAIPWSIPGFIAGGKTGMVQLLNNVCSKLPLLARVTVPFPLLV